MKTIFLPLFLCAVILSLSTSPAQGRPAVEIVPVASSDKVTVVSPSRVSLVSPSTRVAVVSPSSRVAVVSPPQVAVDVVSTSKKSGGGDLLGGLPIVGGLLDGKGGLGGILSLGGGDGGILSVAINLIQAALGILRLGA